MIRPASVGFLSLLLVSGAPLARAAAPSTAESLHPEDQRLGARTTVAVRSAELQQLLAEQSSRYTVRLDAAPEIRWERVTVQARDLPLRQVMAGLQELLNHPWLGSGPRTEPRYTLSPSLRTRQLEKTLWWDTVERGAAPLLRMTTYLARPAEYYARIEQEYYNTRKQPDDVLLRFPNITYLSGTTPRAGLELLASLTPEQRTLLVTDERYMLRWTEMNTAQRKLALHLAGEIGKARARFGERRDERPEEMIEWVQRFGLVLSVKSHPVTGAVTSYGIGEGGAVTTCAALPAVLPSGEVLPVRGRPYEGRRSDGRLPVYGALAAKGFPAAFKQDDLQRQPWAAVVERLASAVGMPVFSDDYPAAPAAGARAGQALPELSRLKLPEALDALCNHYRYLWWYDQGALFFRSRTWFLEKQYQVPPPVLASLRRQLETKGALSVEGLDTLSRLSTRQLIGLNAMAGLEAGALTASTGGSREYRVRMGGREARIAHGYLRVWSKLNASQKAALLRGESLTVAGLSPVQQQAFFELLALEYGPDMVREPARLGFRVEQTVTSAQSGPGQRLIANLTFSCRPRGQNEAPVAERLSIGFDLEDEPAGAPDARGKAAASAS